MPAFEAIQHRSHEGGCTTNCKSVANLVLPLHSCATTRSFLVGGETFTVTPIDLRFPHSSDSFFSLGMKASITVNGVEYIVTHRDSQH
jgi:hypothetical protein